MKERKVTKGKIQFRQVNLCETRESYVKLHFRWGDSLVRHLPSSFTEHHTTTSKYLLYIFWPRQWCVKCLPVK